VKLTSVEDLARLIRRSRQDRSLSQDQLANLSGVARKTVNEVEGGRSDPRISSVIRMLEALDVSLVAGWQHPDAQKTPVETTIDLDAHLDGFREDG
jgi:transcriptional regulator with XRE-family HTH domain